MLDIWGQRVLVVGAGISGLSATRFLLDKGAKVTITDNRARDQFGPELDGLLAAGARLEMGCYPGVGSGEFDFLVVSPGVPLSAPPVTAAKQAGVPVLGELELAYRFARAQVVAITGTNGKTTTTALLGKIFQAAGYRTLVGGNIGLPLVETVEQYGPGDLIVAEVSSFQLETVDQFRPRVAVITNLSPDHLDRHGTMAQYTAAKARIFARQGRGDYTILNYDDPGVRALAGSAPGQVIFFSRRHILEKGVFTLDSNIVARIENREAIIARTSELAMPGPHNLENALAAVAAATLIGVQPATMVDTLKSFAGVAHRLEVVADINGVKYINDSKGTNPEASIKALESFDRPIILLAGGRNKGNDFTTFARMVQEKVRVLVVLGECAGEIEQAARQAGCTRILRAPGFTQAVLLAHQNARPGDVVLLSPACASWDMFNSYEERGDLFRQMVNSFT